MFHGRSDVDDRADEHAGYVAGRYRDGSVSDSWSDVARCAERTFLAYLPRCECGWTGEAHPCDLVGYGACRDQWLHEHLRRAAVDGESG